MAWAPLKKQNSAGSSLNDRADNSQGGKQLKRSVGDQYYETLTDPARKANEGDMWGSVTSRGIWNPTAGTRKDYAKQLGWSKDKQKKKMKESAALREKENLETRGVLDQMKGADNSYIARIDGLSRQAAEQGKDAQLSYTNQIRPRMIEMMEDAKMNADQAMTLEEAGDVNNYMHQQVRGLYEAEGSKARRRGLADTGILQAMGAQATANQMGVGGPMTNAQMQLLSAGNQMQASQAYTRAAGEMERLRQQGIDRGFTESANQYNRGQDAKDRYVNTVGNFEGSMDRNIARQRSFRGEDLGYGGMTHGLQQGGNLRDMGYINQVYGGKQEGINQSIAMANADNAAKAQMTTGILGAAGTIVGGMFGGTAGSAAGGALGGGIGKGGEGMGQAPQQNGGQGYNANQQQRYQNTGWSGGYGQQQPQQQYGSYS